MERHWHTLVSVGRQIQTGLGDLRVQTCTLMSSQGQNRALRTLLMLDMDVEHGRSIPVERRSNVTLDVEAVVSDLLLAELRVDRASAVRLEPLLHGAWWTDVLAPHRHIFGEGQAEEGIDLRAVSRTAGALQRRTFCWINLTAMVGSAFGS
jgi:hypothetical protein